MGDDLGMVMQMRGKGVRLKGEFCMSLLGHSKMKSWEAV